MRYFSSSSHDNLKNDRELPSIPPTLDGGSSSNSNAHKRSGLNNITFANYFSSTRSAFFGHGLVTKRLVNWSLKSARLVGNLSYMIRMKLFNPGYGVGD